MEAILHQFEDDGKIPNSVFPLVVYKKAFAVTGTIAGDMEAAFAGNNWKNSWRNGIYPYHHYHSIAHEVVGVCNGTAKLQLGGGKGKEVAVEAGDVLVIPAGTGHKKLTASDDFTVIGAYPDGMDYDLLTGEEGERHKADDNIARVPFPDNDPVMGREGGIIEFWK